MDENDIARLAFQCALTVHRRLGPGLFESTYEECLAYELDKAGLFFERQKVVPLIYDDIKLELGYRLDFLVEHRVILELKAVESLTDTHLAQMITYLRLTDCRLGLLINFNVALLKRGVRRVVNNL
ncbi:GxxExxY protein [Fibrella arboris]|uniref:GxxExxY protein n=1 Tax=Fibrella arboris TaxID=3242486 RepID=UPI0035201398